MIPYQNCEVVASIIFYIIAKFVCLVVGNIKMYNQSKLSSIPEMDAEEDMARKWVPKKKHEVLKAKYKCLKKLFQIYDASVIGIMPEPDLSLELEEAEKSRANRRRKRTHHTQKTDACAGTTELSGGDISTEYENSIEGDRPNLQRGHSCISTQMDTKIDQYSETCPEIEKAYPSEDMLYRKESELFMPHRLPNPLPYLVLNERRKLTRFQCFVQRIFGIRREYSMLPKDQIYSASDSMVRDKRRRRGLRFRRLRRAKKIKSESSLRDIKSPVILSCVQAAQRSCLADTTPRHCPILGCKMVAYGIINYNDHLNLCHFKDRKYICHYCHEGFEKEYDKLVHENEHIGLSKLGSDVSNLSSARSSKIASNTQTEPDKIGSEKLKKIVSFFDKISDPEQMISEMKKNRASECNLRSDCGSFDDEKIRTTSCCNIRRKSVSSSSESMGSAASKRFGPHIACHFCGEKFHFRRQLSLHVNLEHGAHDKYSKYHSCAGLVHASPRVDMTSEDGHIQVHSDRSKTDEPQRKSSQSLTRDPSTSIVYYSSSENLDARYSWEPGRVIRV